MSSLARERLRCWWCAGEAKQPYEIPYAEAYLERVDLAAKEIRMKLPEGMLEINAPVTSEEKRHKDPSTE